MSPRHSQAVGVIGLLAVATAILLRLSPAADGRQPMLQIGSHLAIVQSIAAAANHNVLVIYIHSQCAFCSDSMPFYARLSALSGRRPIIVVGVEPELTLRTYLASHNVVVDDVISTAGAPVGLRGTPAIALVTKNGTIENLWRGRLAPAAEAVVLDAALSPSDSHDASDRR